MSGDQCRSRLGAVWQRLVDALLHLPGELGWAVRFEPREKLLWAVVRWGERMSQQDLRDSCSQASRLVLRSALQVVAGYCKGNGVVIRRPATP